ncbi:hypothetical protein QFC24_004048 [Naganishia onofrii]|uniref:Uncharacterized protein n=1 Tax=Naganishia onofrii TaxID=1851511 RepID=A0ACC2XG30_9TREE|nr:hypothetical protein QFC24_004048 [Naganishia onofrii]
MSEPTGTKVLKSYKVVLFGTYALDAITMSYGMSPESTAAILRLFQHRPGSRTGQEYGADGRTKLLLEAHFRLIESFCIMAAGVITRDLPTGGSRTRQQSSPFLDVNLYRTAASHYRALLQIIPANQTNFGCNVQTPCIERRGKLSASAFNTDVLALVAYNSASEVLEAHARRRYLPLPLPIVNHLGHTPHKLNKAEVDRLKFFWVNSERVSRAFDPQNMTLTTVFEAVRPQTFVSTRVINRKILLFEKMNNLTSNLLNDFKLVLRMNIPGPQDPNPAFRSRELVNDTGQVDVSLQNYRKAAATICIQITDLDEYGLVRKDLKGIIVWLADDDRQIIKVLGRIPLREDIEFKMTPNDCETFRRIGCLLRVASYHIAINQLFKQADGPLYNANLSFPPAPLDAAAKYLDISASETHGVNQQPQWRRLEPCWQQVFSGNTKESTELDLRAGEAAYHALPSSKREQRELKIWKGQHAVSRANDSPTGVPCTFHQQFVAHGRASQIG